MSNSIRTNLSAMNSARHLNSANQGVAQSQERIASGTRLNHASDDPSGFGIAGTMDANIHSLRQAATNADQAANMLAVGDSGLESITDKLIRLRELSISAASSTVDASGRKAMEIEAEGLRKEIDQTANTARFGDKNLLNGQSGKLDFQVGTSSNPNDRISYESQDARSSGLGVDNLKFGDERSAGNNLDKIDSALNQVESMRGHIGALQNRLLSASDQATSRGDIATADLSNRRDTDYAAEATNLSKNTIRQNASTAILAQANQQPGTLLRLLKND